MAIVQNGFTLAEATAQLEEYKKASLAVAKNQEYYIGDLRFTRADAEQIRKSISYWSDMIATLSGSNRPTSYTVGF